MVRVAKLIWLHGDGHLLESIRLALEMGHTEFAQLLGLRLGWNVPTAVLRVWEAGQVEPPDEVFDVAQTLTESRYSPPAPVDSWAVNSHRSVDEPG